jgi:hypothetical protein
MIDSKTYYHYADHDLPIYDYWVLEKEKILKWFSNNVYSEIIEEVSTFSQVKPKCLLSYRQWQYKQREMEDDNANQY